MYIKHACRDSGHLVFVATQCSLVAPNICVSSVCKLLHVNLLAPRFLWWLLYFLKIVHSWHVVISYVNLDLCPYTKGFCVCSARFMPKCKLLSYVKRNIKSRHCLWQRRMFASSKLFFVTNMLQLFVWWEVIRCLRMLPLNGWDHLTQCGWPKTAVMA